MNLLFDVFPPVLVRKDSHGEAQLVLLDHGLYENIGNRERVALANMYKAIVLKDEPAMRTHSEDLNVKGTSIAL